MAASPGLPATPKHNLPEGLISPAADAGEGDTTDAISTPATTTAFRSLFIGRTVAPAPTMIAVELAVELERTEGTGFTPFARAVRYKSTWRAGCCHDAGCRVDGAEPRW